MIKLIIFIAIAVLFLAWGVVQAFDDNDNDWGHDFLYLLFKRLIYKIIIIGTAYFIIF